MSPRVAVSRQGGSKPANQILLQDNYIHKYYDDNNVYVDRNQRNGYILEKCALGRYENDAPI